jgi:hypothetical protein
MNYKFFKILFFFLIIGCTQNNVNTNLTINPIFDQKYKNKGFGLVYNSNLKKEKKISKKIDDRSLAIFHKSLKKGSFVKITNPDNEKTIIATVSSNTVEFSQFFNSVITSRIVEELELNINEPYIEISLISANSTFVAKRAKTFEEEKNVAEKAPVDGIKISNLNSNSSNTEQKKDRKFSYSIKIADFYYEDSAQNMIERIKKETSFDNPKIIKLSKTKFRVLLGPFNDIKTLEEIFNEIKSLEFENLEILRNV